MDSDAEKLGELIKDVRIAMLTTVRRDGTLHTRPLATLKYENDGELWFFTSVDSAKVDEIEDDLLVSVAYADTDQNVYVAVSALQWWCAIVAKQNSYGPRWRKLGFRRAWTIRSSRCCA